MMKKSIYGIILCLSTISFITRSEPTTPFTLSLEQRDGHTFDITLQASFQSPNYLYAKHLAFSVDSPDMTLSPWKSSHEPTTIYNNAHKESEEVFDKPVVITMQAYSSSATLPEDAHLHIAYFLKSDKKINSAVIPLALKSQTEQPLEQTASTYGLTANPATQAAIQTNAVPEQSRSWSNYFSHLVETTQSLPIRLVLVLILGMLLSFTPCIYPMIPITIGILQSQGSCSFGRSFMLALSYATGIATTFAFLGLIAASTGQLFGSLLTSPVFVLIVVGMLAYLAGSMLGFYEMYVPRIFRTQLSSNNDGSLLSAFLFGAASGTFASPCVSPGLVLLLSIVTALGNKILGFVFLFVFGIGLSVPLLLIGTFSNSLNMLPRAGQWMVYLKQFFGLIMVGTCFYFLSMIVPLYVVLLLMIASCFIAAVMLLYTTQRKPSQSYMWFKQVFAVCLLAGTLPASLQVYKIKYVSEQESKNSVWLHDYQEALTQARLEKKAVVIDFGAPFCSLCKAIDKKLLNDAQVVTNLKQCVAVKIDSSDTSHPHNGTVSQQYGVIGVPVLLLIDAETETVIKRWGAELFDMPKENFMQELSACISHDTVTACKA